MDSFQTKNSACTLLNLNNKGRLDGDIWGLCVCVFVYGGVSQSSFIRMTLDMRITDNLRRVTHVMSPITVSYSTHTNFTNIQNNNQRDLASAHCHCGQWPQVPALPV